MAKAFGEQPNDTAEKMQENTKENLSVDVTLDQAQRLSDAQKEMCANTP